ncbi:UNVERIFIED_CONTAM: hypothetical protein GTU68_062620 [Idotea baltica]|nr:hypothetical protein [Idotea baltica]
MYHVYKLDSGGPGVEELEGAGAEDIPAATHWLLPATDFQNLWDTLIFDTDVKEQVKLLCVKLWLRNSPSDLATATNMDNYLKSIPILYSQNGSQKAENWCRSSSRRSRNWWRTPSRWSAS